MRNGFVSAAAILAATFGLTTACSSSGTSSPASAEDAGSGSDAGRDANVDAGGQPAQDAGTDALPSGPARMRLANLSPDANGVDYCIRLLSDVDYAGPKVGGAGLAYGTVTAYVEVPAGASSVRVVAAGSKDCTTALDDTDVDFQPGSTTTVAVEGELADQGNDPGLAGYVYQDDAKGPSTGIGLRFIHAAPGLTIVDFGLGSLAGADYTPIFTGVTFGTAGGQGEASGETVDANGYVDRSAMSAQAVSEHTVGVSTDDVKSSAVTIGDGSFTTIFLVGGKSGDTAHPVQLLQCDDGAPAVNGLSKCAFDAP